MPSLCVHSLSSHSIRPLDRGGRAARRSRRVAAARGRHVAAPSAQYSSNSAPASANAGAREAPTPAELATRAQEAVELLQEIAEIAFATGPSGVSRALVAAQACTTLGARILRDPQNPPKPEELVRQLFEALGATYM